MASLWLLPNPLWQAMQRHFKYGQRTQQEWNVIIEDEKHEARKGRARNKNGVPIKEDQKEWC
jgi:hypothetical protein